MKQINRGRRAPIAALSALCICALAGRSFAARTNHPHPASAASAPAGVTKTTDASPESSALQRQIDALLSTAPISTGQVSIEVRALDTGRVLYAHNPNELLNPASNTKVATAAASLLRLGPEYRFTTDVLADRTYANGRARTLYVKGRGDPSITTERLDAFARDLVHRGLIQVGDVVLDDTWFDRETWGPGWETETSDKAYASGVGALSLNRNSVGIYVLPGDRAGQRAKVTLDPEAKGFFDLGNSVQTTRADQRKRAVPHSYALSERTRITVSGRIAIGGDPIILYRRVTDPAFYFGYAFRQILQQHGVRVTGQVKRGVVPTDAKFVTSYDSPELGEVVRDMNKASSNFIAEMLLKTLGAEVMGAPGTWPKGVAAMEDALAELGLAKGTYQLRNGSGLNDTNRFSSHQLASLLATLYTRFPLAAEFIASLPVAARDGSLRLRMDGTEAAGKMRAKTGTLDRAVALSGFIQTVSGEELVFSFMANDWNGKVPPIIQAADKFGALLATVGERPSEVVQTVALELSAPEQQLRLASYAQLAQAHDKKNLGILRAAARTERDPIVRLAAADALFRTDPENGTGPLLEALPPGLELFNRLRAQTAALKLPLPVLPSLLDMAAEGNMDAFTRILTLCPPAIGTGAPETASLAPIAPPVAAPPAAGQPALAPTAPPASANMLALPPAAPSAPAQLAQTTAASAATIATPAPPGAPVASAPMLNGQTASAPALAASGSVPPASAAPSVPLAPANTPQASATSIATLGVAAAPNSSAVASGSNPAAGASMAAASSTYGSGPGSSSLSPAGPRAPPRPFDEPLARALADGLADVSEASPDETLSALKSAPLEQARAAAELLGWGFANSGIEMDASAFAQLLLAAAAHSDADGAEARRWVKLIEQRGSRLAPSAPAEAASASPNATSATGSGG